MKATKKKRPASTKRSTPAKRTPRATSTTRARGGDAIASYAQRQTPAARALCDRLRELIDAALPKATSKIWHGGPVWFDGENPVVGYDASANGVKLLFWNGCAFGDDALAPVGKHGAAGCVFTSEGELDERALRRWLKLARENVFDSVAYFAKLRADRAAGKR